MSGVRCLSMLALLFSAAPVVVDGQRAPAELGDTFASVTWYGKFSSPRGAFVLHGGKLLVADSRDKRVVVVDTVTGSATTAIGDGDGPQETKGHRGFVAMAGDSVGAYGLDVKRLVIMDGTGHAVRTVLLDSLEGPMQFYRLTAGGDAGGRIAFSSSRPPSRSNDSADVVVVDLRDGVVSAMVVGQVWEPAPGGVRPDSAKFVAGSVEPDQVVLLESGMFAVYSSNRKVLDIRTLDWQRLPAIPLPGRDRIFSRSELATARREAQSTARMADSLARAASRRGDSVASRLAQLAGSMAEVQVPTALPAYRRNSIVALTPHVVAIERFREASDIRGMWDWANVITGESGSFTAPAGYSLLGARRGMAVWARDRGDGLQEVAGVKLDLMLR